MQEKDGVSGGVRVSGVSMLYVLTEELFFSVAEYYGLNDFEKIFSVFPHGKRTGFADEYHFYVIVRKDSRKVQKYLLRNDLFFRQLISKGKAPAGIYKKVEAGIRGDTEAG